jgi:hypothetical protein
VQTINTTAKINPRLITLGILGLTAIFRKGLLGRCQAGFHLVHAATLGKANWRVNSARQGLALEVSGMLNLETEIDFEQERAESAEQKPWPEKLWNDRSWNRAPEVSINARPHPSPLLRGEGATAGALNGSVANWPAPRFLILLPKCFDELPPATGLGLLIKARDQYAQSPFGEQVDLKRRRWLQVVRLDFCRQSQKVHDLGNTIPRYAFSSRLLALVSPAFRSSC